MTDPSADPNAANDPAPSQQSESPQVADSKLLSDTAAIAHAGTSQRSSEESAVARKVAAPPRSEGRRRAQFDETALGAPQPLGASDEAFRLARLNKMKRWAVALLILAAVIFAVASALESRYPWLGIVRATAEASMIGGLADWFAVTALFRHPLGIPIPHTAIIPKRKDRVGATLGAFVQRNFLNRDVVAAKLHSLHAAERIARWMVEPENARMLARQIGRLLTAAGNVLRDEDVENMLTRAARNRIERLQAAPMLGRFLSVLTAGNKHQALLDDAIRMLARGISENQDLIRDRVESESPWWIPGVIDDKIAKRIVTALDRTMQAIKDDPEHPLRLRFDAAIDEFIVKLQASPEVILRAEQIKDDVLNAEAVRGFSAAVWQDLKASMMQHAEDPEGFKPEAVQRTLTALGDALLNDPVLMEKVDGWLIDGVSAAIDKYQDEVGELIAATVRRWDPNATSRRIELAIGRDLQFIRINGTLVGGLAGMLLYLLQRAF